MRGKARQPRLMIGCAALVLLALATSAGNAVGAAKARFEAPTLAGLGYSAAFGRTSTLTAAGMRKLATSTWWGGRFTVGSGEAVTVYVSAAYGQDDAKAREWANWFASLPHGSELGVLTAYFAPLAEVESICGATDVLGCYYGQKLVSVGDFSTGIPPASVAAHEYGHHIANNRLNSPWPAIDWGTKRWATYMGVCTRVKSGTAFPGDEGMNYSRNPGEAFAESYRVLVETNGTAQDYDWPIVDPSFRPDPQSLAALREDVLHPWPGSATTTLRGKFLRRSRLWSMRSATPLDGDLRIGLTAPGAGGNDVTLLSSDGRTVLAAGSWDSSGGKSAEYRVCGARSVKVRVTRGGAAARFSLRVTVP